TLYVNEVNLGVGSNYAEGAFRCRGKYYRMICGDNVESKETLVSIFKHIGEADMIIPYPADTTFRGPFRRGVSRTFTLLVDLLSGYRIRYYNGLAVHFRYNVMRWHSNSHGFGFQADLITRLLDLKASYIECTPTSGPPAPRRPSSFVTSAPSVTRCSRSGSDGSASSSTRRRPAALWTNCGCIAPGTSHRT
ncbi:hypothetical protein EBR04_10780, partial [bacterium]|nr:hypothetical protein [bacterium]